MHTNQQIANEFTTITPQNVLDKETIYGCDKIYTAMFTSAIAPFVQHGNNSYLPIFKELLHKCIQMKENVSNSELNDISCFYQDVINDAQSDDIYKKDFNKKYLKFQESLPRMFQVYIFLQKLLKSGESCDIPQTKTKLMEIAKKIDNQEQGTELMKMFDDLNSMAQGTERTIVTEKKEELKLEEVVEEKKEEFKLEEVVEDISRISEINSPSPKATPTPVKSPSPSPRATPTPEVKSKVVKKRNSPKKRLNTPKKQPSPYVGENYLCTWRIVSKKSNSLNSKNQKVEFYKIPIKLKSSPRATLKATAKKLKNF